MKKPEKERITYSSIGYCLMLTIIIILLLVIFGVLSVSASLRDYEYSKRGAKKTTEYYEANSKAYDILRQMDAIFIESTKMQDTQKSISESLDVTVQIVDEKTAMVYYEVESGTRQKLQIRLEVTKEAESTSYKIVEWQENTCDSWESNTMLPVIGKE